MDTPGLDIVRNVGVGQEGEGTTGIEFYANFDLTGQGEINHL